MHINLTDRSDFPGGVHAKEAERVTITILNIVRNSMSSLQRLTFDIDDRSRLHDNFVVFFPAAWFLEKLLDIRHLREIKLRATGTFGGYGSVRDTHQVCIRALNIILKEHLGAVDEEDRVNFGVTSGREVRARVGRKMLRLVEDWRPDRADVWKKLEEQCWKLETDNSVVV